MKDCKVRIWLKHAVDVCKVLTLDDHIAAEQREPAACPAHTSGKELALLTPRSATALGTRAPRPLTSGSTDALHPPCHPERRLMHAKLHRLRQTSSLTCVWGARLPAPDIPRGRRCLRKSRAKAKAGAPKVSRAGRTVRCPCHHALYMTLAVDHDGTLDAF